jgi:uracil-DNA glycosylase family 4
MMDVKFSSEVKRIMFESIEQMNSILIECSKCPRLVKFRKEVASRKSRFYGQNFWSRPVPGFGNINSRLLILGLAPAATGGNRTGRVFTGDKSASFLFSCLYVAGLSNKPDSISKDDGLFLEKTYITAALKCVPPGDKPTREELDNCKQYLHYEISSMKNLKGVLVLGRTAFESFKRYLMEDGKSVRELKFANGKSYDVGGIRIYCSYHPSPRNVNTGRLKKDGMISLLIEIRDYISSFH